jgi:hypothetical protein
MKIIHFSRILEIKHRIYTSKKKEDEMIKRMIITTKYQKERQIGEKQGIYRDKQRI